MYETYGEEGEYMSPVSDNLYEGIKCISGAEAFDELVRHFMGDGYYIVDQIHAHEANYVILQEVKAAYPRGSIRIIRKRY